MRWDRCRSSFWGTMCRGGMGVGAAPRKRRGGALLLSAWVSDLFTGGWCGLVWSIRDKGKVGGISGFLFVVGSNFAFQKVLDLAIAAAVLLVGNDLDVIDELFRQCNGEVSFVG